MKDDVAKELDDWTGFDWEHDRYQKGNENWAADLPATELEVVIVRQGVRTYESNCGRKGKGCHRDVYYREMTGKGPTLFDALVSLANGYRQSAETFEKRAGQVLGRNGSREERRCCTCVAWTQAKKGLNGWCKTLTMGTGPQDGCSDWRK